MGDVLGLRFLAEVHTSHKFPSMQTQIALFPIPMSHSMLAESSSTQHSTVDRTHQPDIRPESANPVNPGCFDHCCPLEFAAQFELNEGRFLNAAAANTIKAQALRHQSCRKLDERREQDRDSAQDKSTCST